MFRRRLLSPRRALLALVTGAALIAGVAGGPAVAADRGERGHARTQDAMEALVREQGVPGVSGRTEGPDGVWHGAAGVADRNSGRPPLPGDRFRIGSITKTFVAVAMLQLVAEGKLDLDDPVESLLPGVVRGHGHDGRGIAVRQLLNHTSGIRDYTSVPAFRRMLLGPGFVAHRFDTRTPRELVGIAMTRPPAFPPGRDWGYSNTNYVLAGMVIEAVTGEDYATLIERRVLRPAGLDATTLPGTSPEVPGRHGRGYTRLGDGDGGGTRLHEVTRLDPSLAGAAGEMVSTAADLLAFLHALRDGRLLPAAQLAQLTETVPVGAELPGVRYGLGIRSQRLSCGVTVWGHDGGISGSGATAVISADGSRAAVFHTNGDWARPGERLLEAEFCG